MKSSLQYILHALAFAGASLAVPKAQVVPGARWTDVCLTVLITFIYTLTWRCY